MIVNLFNIRHLDISDSVSLESSYVLLEILKETPQLLSLDFDKSILMSFLKNDELCDYLNKMIKTLHERIFFMIRNFRMVVVRNRALMEKSPQTMSLIKLNLNSLIRVMMNEMEVGKLLV